MRRLGAVCLIFAAGLQAQTPKKKVLAIGASQGYEHETISDGLVTIWKLGKESGLWDTVIRTDTDAITKKKRDRNGKNLEAFDAVFFYTLGELNMNAEQKASLLAFIKDDGKGFVGTHSAPDTFFTWPEYGEMMGGYFDLHPWNQKVGIRVEDRKFPAMRHFPERFEIADEIYQFKDFSRDRVRVLMSLDVSTVDLSKEGVHRTDNDFAVSWARQYGKGRVFFCSLGHREEVWNRPDMQKMWLEAMKWALGLTQGDATPRPSHP